MKIIDIWQENVITDWDAADFWITCASWTQGLEDRQFGARWRKLAELSKPRGAYFAQYFDVDSADQARKFANILLKYGGVKPGDRLFTDCEVGQLSLTGIIDFIYNLQFLLGNPQNVRYGLYSRKNILDPLSTVKLSESQKVFLKSIDLWVAGHPTELTPIFPPPTAYIPDQTKYGKPVLFQYGTDLDPAQVGVAGVSGGIDLNTGDPAYLDEWKQQTGAVMPPPNGGTMQYQVVWSKGASVRPQPNTGGIASRVLPVGAIVDVNQDGIPDSADLVNPNKRWVQLADLTGYAASDYPDSSNIPQQRMKPISAPPPPPDQTVIVNISATINGKTYGVDNVPLSPR